MRALLSTIGSRGDVQPLVALAMELRAHGADVRLCVPPDFREWIESLGIPVVTIGPVLRATALAAPSTPSPSPERVRELADATVAAQFETILAAAERCDVIVAATALQIAARSVAEHLGIGYHFVAYCPAVLPSPHHAPPPLSHHGDVPDPPRSEFAALWRRDGERFGALFGATLDAHRSRLGLPPVDDVRRHVLTDRPWLAADATLAPWPDEDAGVVQTGAWIVPDSRPLSPAVERFLDAGAPPVYFGFGSMRAPTTLGRAMVDAARAVGRRAIVSRGWAELSVGDDADDGLAIDEVNQQALFARVPAVVHHGGAGTTTAAARAGAPQVVVPQLYDQHYWAGRVRELGIGIAHAPGTPTAESLASALALALEGHASTRARALSTAVRDDGARIAARLLLERGR